MSFKVGDKVEAFGVEGEVISDEAFNSFPILVRFESGKKVAFTEDGMQYTWHKTPSLKLIERPKKTKVFKEWIGKDGLMSGYLIDENFKGVEGDCYKASFLMWTGREFELEVEG